MQMPLSHHLVQCHGPRPQCTIRTWRPLSGHHHDVCPSFSDLPAHHSASVCTRRDDSHYSCRCNASPPALETYRSSHRALMHNRAYRAAQAFGSTGIEAVALLQHFSSASELAAAERNLLPLESPLSSERVARRGIVDRRAGPAFPYLCSPIPRHPASSIAKSTTANQTSQGDSVLTISDSS